MTTFNAQAYALGDEQHERASDHRQRALDALSDGDAAHVALAHALLAVEARIDELTAYIASR
jgi:hypothetical protein